MINYIKRGSVHVTALGLLLGVAGIASADEVTFVGSTLGQFNAQAFATTNSILDLHYSNSTFNNTTVGNALDLGGNPNPGSNVDNLGSLELDWQHATLRLN